MRKQAAPTPSEVLRPEVAAEYQVVDGVLSHFIDSELGEVDLTKIDLEFAARVADRGYLKKLGQAARE